jgi:hypothetical protein
MTKQIIFSSPIADYIEHPIPALKNIPEEYKKLEKYIDKDVWSPSVKSCMPFLDALTCGYILTMPVDVCFKINKYEKEKSQVTELSLHWNHLDAKLYKYFQLTSHRYEQVPQDLRYKHRTLDVPLKLQNPWFIKTPPGYSCLITQPFNRNSPIKVVDGIVDTDVFELGINTVFYWTQDTDVKETFLSKGHPIALVVPFKRDDWKIKVETVDEEKDNISRLKYSKFLFDSYRKIFWNKKSFR